MQRTIAFVTGILLCGMTTSKKCAQYMYSLSWWKFNVQDVLRLWLTQQQSWKVQKLIRENMQIINNISQYI